MKILAVPGIALYPLAETWWKVEDRGSMRRMALTARIGWLLRLACILALVLVAHAHRPATLGAAGSLSSAELAAFVLPDGSLPDICHVADGGEGEGTHRDHPCDFCRIASAAALPLSPSAPPAVFSARAVASVAISEPGTVRRRCFPPSAPPHGPPLARTSIVVMPA